MQSTQENETSLCDKMEEAYRLSIRLIYDGCKHAKRCEHDCEPVDVLAKYGKEVDDFVWSWTDGLMHKYYNDRSSGHCSLQSFIDFDIEVFEKEVDSHIGLMKHYLSSKGN